MKTLYRTIAPPLGLAALVITSCSDRGSSPSSAATVQIEYPSPWSMTSADFLSVRVRASHPQGVRSVHVGGVPALHQRSLGLWIANVALPASGVSGLSVNVIDGGGREHLSVGSVAVTKTALMAQLGDVGIDTGRTELMAMEVSPPRLVSIDYVSSQRRLISGGDAGGGRPFVSPGPVALDPQGATVFVGDGNLLLAVDRTTGDRTILSGPGVGVGHNVFAFSALDHDPAMPWVVALDASAGTVVGVDTRTGSRALLSGAGHGIGPALMPSIDIAVDWARSQALVTIPGGVVRVDLITGNRVDFSTAFGPGGPLFIDPTRLWIDAVNDAVLIADEGLDSLLRVDLATGATTLAADLPATAPGPIPTIAALVVDLRRSRAYLSWTELSDELLSINLTNGQLGIELRPTLGTGPRWAGATGVGAEPFVPRALATIGDDLVEVSLVGGDRTVIYQSPSGPFGDIVLTPLDPHIGVARVSALPRSDALLARGTDLLSYEPSTVREVATGFGRPLASLTFAPGGPVFAIGHDPAQAPDELYTINIAAQTHHAVLMPAGVYGPIAYHANSLAVLTFERTGPQSANLIAVLPDSAYSWVISGDGVGLGPPLRTPVDLVVDADRNRAFVLEADQVLEVDLATGTRTDISSSVRGGGPPLLGGVVLDYDARSAVIMVVDANRDAMYAIDPLSGDRVAISR